MMKDVAVTRVEAMVSSIQVRFHNSFEPVGNMSHYLTTHWSEDAFRIHDCWCHLFLCGDNSMRIMLATMIPTSLLVK